MGSFIFLAFGGSFVCATFGFELPLGFIVCMRQRLECDFSNSMLDPRPLCVRFIVGHMVLLY